MKFNSVSTVFDHILSSKPTSVLIDWQVPLSTLEGAWKTSAGGVVQVSGGKILLDGKPMEHHEVTLEFLFLGRL